ncbi:hypothetical protein H2201_004410 [Coniosporium apollinis]|uniref:Leucine rich repeat domain-containing protein n=1 Tax=Coniosporium apollinis TaxID=61459 RepID=A0ABQ9NY68_9PEZI|nr:hypothetical protein H2201_004410 [Coniosporium apollinis]
MDTEDGSVFIKNLAYFVRTHEKALANALQLQRQAPRNASSPPSGSTTAATTTSSSASATFAAALSLPYLSFTSQNIKPVKLTLTPHHLFFLLSRFEELGIPVGPMNVRLENIHTDASPTNYVSFLSQAQRKKSRNSDRDSTHSVSSIRSVMSGMASLWSSFGLSNSAAKSEKQKAAIQEDLKYLYSAFTKIPCVRLAPDHKARLIAGYEEFPFDSAVPLFAFKNLSALEVYDVDFRQFYGWDRLADQLRSLTLKRAGVDNPADVLINIVLDDMDKRRRRSAKIPPSPAQPWPAPSPSLKQAEMARSDSGPDSPSSDKPGSASSPQNLALARGASRGSKSTVRTRQRSVSPSRPGTARHGSSHGLARSSTPQLRRSSGSSGSSIRSNTPRGSSSNLLSLGAISSSKWRFLRHLSLADNSMTTIAASSLAPLTNTLQSLDLSSNLFTEIPDSLASLVALRALNLSCCMIESLHSLARNPLPAITTLNLRGNRLASLAGIERLLSLERLDLRDNKLTDPTELARLTGIPDMQEIFVSRNPFVKTHSSYRVTIFNLFRAAPGYSEDIIIDSTGPGYSERKQLIDRVPEVANVPVMKPPIEEDDVPVPVSEPSGLRTPTESPAPVDDPRKQLSSYRSRSEYAVSSQRRRKGPKRRIVELSQSDALPHSLSESTITPPSQPIESASEDSTYGGSPVATPTRKPSAPLKTDIQEREQPGLSMIDTTVKSPSLDTPLKRPPLVSTEYSSNGDLYKKKIEALRNDFGNGWLSALGDGSWEGARTNSYSDGTYTPPGALRPTVPSVRSPSQGIVSGGRTLG